jgi:pimeloyl-ACP methyl ester carboxylesterase
MPQIGPTYHEITGSGEPLVLLHGGFCSMEVMRELGDALAEGYQVHSPERPGHGRTPDEPEPFDYTAMVSHTLEYLDAVGVKRAHLVGFSDGAIAGLLLARDHPERVASLVAISGNLDPSGFVPDEEAAGSMTNEQHQKIRDEYERLSPDGAAHAQIILDKLTDLWLKQPQITPASLGQITAPTLVMAGDRDVIALDHTATIARSITGAQLCIVPDAGHLLIRECPALIARLIRRFLSPN